MSEIEPQWIASVAARLEGPCGVPDGTPLVAACSGGADSVFLVHVLGALRDRWPLEGVVFIDHQLRDVRAEAAASRAAAQALGRPWSRLEVTLPSGGNLQDAARTARYEALLGACTRDAVVATGHTRDDQAETVVQRLIRGSGLRGLSGIASRRGRIVRPLLDVTREATRTAGLDFVDDPSNATARFQRNRIRHDVLPRLEEESAGALTHLAHLADRATSELALIDALMESGVLDTQMLGDHPRPWIETLVRWRARRELPAAVRPSDASLRQAARLLENGADDARTSLGGGWSARCRHGHLSFVEDHDLREHLVVPGVGSYGCAHVVAELVPAAAALTLEPLEGAIDTWLDSNRLTWPLTLKREPAGELPNRPWALQDAAGAVLWRSSELTPRDSGDIFMRMKMRP